MSDACRIEFSRAALQHLGSLSPAEKTRLEDMLLEIGAEFAASRSASGSRFGGPALPVSPLADELLSLQIGRATVRYSIDAGGRILTVKHVLVTRHAPFAVTWTAQAGAQMSAIHPEIREHIVRQIEQVARLAGAEAALQSGYRNSPPRELVWSYEGHTVSYTVDDGRFTLTVVEVLGPGTRSAC